eukprot:jgi/Tetstr1/420449/TSEL_011562.t1
MRLAARPAAGSRASAGAAGVRGSPLRPALRAVAPARTTRAPLRIAAKGGDWTDEDDAEFEARLAQLKTAKGQTPMGQGKKSEKKVKAKGPDAVYTPKTYDFTGETVYYEGPPSRGDLAVNILLGTTLLWLPLTFAAVGRGAFVKYRFTDKRFSVETNAPWQTEKTDVAYPEVEKVVSIPRGIGAWGDMVVTLKNGDKVEFRALDRFKELEKYILERREAMTK